MQHKGEIIEKAIRASGYSITMLTKKLKKSRRWMYHVFENPNVSIDLVLQIGEIIHYDFSDDIKELKKYKNLHKASVLNETAVSFKQKEETENWKDKYLALLEKYNALLIEIAGKKRKKP